ncbi:MAG: hypothetical protein V3U49_07710 [Nitrososphaerales archaeon]
MTEFQFKVGDLNFHSSLYELLVIAGPHAKFKGTGTSKGESNFGFMVTATDGNINGSGDVDKFRIKIFDKDDNDRVVYDNPLTMQMRQPKFRAVQLSSTRNKHGIRG